MQDIMAKAARIQWVVFDVDGVLTDGSLIFGPEGEEYKAFNSRDGHGMKMLQKYGVGIAIITGRTSGCVAHRMKGMGIERVYQGHLEKLPAFETMVAELGVALEQIAYVGDDVVDLPIMRRVGLAIAVQDAHPLVKKHAHWQTPSVGGRGAGRDVCELIMEARGVLDAEMEIYLA